MNLHPHDLQLRAQMAARSLSSLVDPDRAGLIYFLATWQTRPPRASHGLWDFGDGSGRHLDALCLARTMARPEDDTRCLGLPNDQIEAWVMRLLGPDGLSWLPLEPWAKPWNADMLVPGYKGDEPVAEISWAQRGTLLGLTTRYLATGDVSYSQAGRRLVEALLRIAQRTPDGLFFPEGYYRKSGWRRRDPGLCPGLEEYNAAVAVAAVRFAYATGHDASAELARGLIGFARQHTTGYSPEGLLIGEPGSGLLDHFHTRSNCILGALELGELTSDAELISWARRSYEAAREWGTDFGWFPEGLGRCHGEICCTTDMIEIAIGLGLHVDRTYFADAERFGRNHLFASQFLCEDALRAAVNRLPEQGAGAPMDRSVTIDVGVLESQVGGFTSRPTLNDAFHLDSTAMMQCCNASGTRGLYALWRYATEMRTSGGFAQCLVHMRFSVVTPDVQVVSHEPAEGRLEVTVRRDCQVSVRLPVGETTAEARVQGDPETMRLRAVEGYVSFMAEAGRPVVVWYGLPERRVHYTVGGEGTTMECEGHWRGEALIRVDPPGRYLPLYDGPFDLPPVQPALPEGPPIDSISRASQEGFGS